MNHDKIKELCTKVYDAFGKSTTTETEDLYAMGVITGLLATNYAKDNCHDLLIDQVSDLAKKMARRTDVVMDYFKKNPEDLARAIKADADDKTTNNIINKINDFEGKQSKCTLGSVNEITHKLIDVLRGSTEDGADDAVAICAFVAYCCYKNSKLGREFNLFDEIFTVTKQILTDMVEQGKD